MDHERLRLRIVTLANEVLGERERQVFLARSLTDSDQVPSLEAFADRFGVTTTRVHQIEVSARRKIATALAASGYGAVTGDDVVAHLSQIRARRAAGRTSADKSPDRYTAADKTFELLAAAH